MKQNYKDTIPETWRAMSKVFVALGDEHRQRILLLFEPGDRLNVGQIAAVSTLARSSVSHHLKILREAGILRAEKIGKEVWFEINRDWLLSVFDNVSNYIREST
ncbi:MAG: winged helix-turn-helix transcriptional regulator [Magnetococcales bacterium]|nr:winged helix-turn-helix transcriptional regulator [Magnetococcales bacterium]